MFKCHWFKRRWFSRQRGNRPIATAGYVLALLGGIIIILLSLAALLNLPLALPFRSPLTGYFGIGVITLILGVVAVIGSKRVHHLAWAVVLMAVGFLGGGIGGLLALLGGLLGLVSIYI
jgi:hypothetical protein